MLELPKVPQKLKNQVFKSLRLFEVQSFYNKLILFTTFFLIRGSIFTIRGSETSRPTATSEKKIYIRKKKEKWE